MSNRKQPLGDHPANRLSELNADAPNIGAQGAFVDHPGFRVRDRMEGEGPLRVPVDGFQREEFRQYQAANCAGMYQNANCGGDPYWRPQDGQWWTYPGIGGTSNNWLGGSVMATNPQNPSGFDFVGGSATNPAIAPMSVSGTLGQYNDGIEKSGFSVVVNQPLRKVQERSYYNCNCGLGGAGTSTYNCYTDCNCNCNCDCNCDCDCDCGCFPAGTLVTMADGSEKKIEKVVAGDRIQGAFGITNRVLQVDPVVCPPVLWEINDGLIFLPGNHRLWIVDKGWGCVDLDYFYGGLVSSIANGYARERGWDWVGEKPASLDRPLSRIEIGTKLAYGPDGYVEVESLTRHETGLPDHLFGLVLHNGSGSYTDAGGLWSTGYADWSFDFESHVRSVEGLIRCGPDGDRQRSLVP